MAAPMLTKRTALVTGASRGMGKAIAIALAEAGAAIAVNYRRRKAMVSSVENALGPVDILINNAGIVVRHSLKGEERFHAVAVHREATKLNIFSLSLGEVDLRSLMMVAWTPDLRAVTERAKRGALNCWAA